MQPSVTVLMTVYNGRAYLKTAIKSVLDQSFRDFEFLIIDDCSSDDSVDTIQSFSDERIVLHRNKINIGQTKSLNIGLRMARGEFIARMDADDFAYKTWLQEQLFNICSLGKECVLCSSQAVIVDTENEVHKILNTPENFKEIVIKSLWASPVNHVGVLMRRQAILDQGGYDDNFRIAADYALWSKFLRNGFILAVTPRPLVAIRNHTESVTVMAAGKADIAEVSRIMGENITHWSGVQLGEDQQQLLWRLIYNSKSLTIEQMALIYDIFCQVSRDFIVRNHFPASDARRIFMNQATKIFMKKIFDCINRRDILGLRDVAHLYMGRHGSRNLFVVIWVLSYMPYVLFGLPAFYLKFRKMITYRRMG